VYSKSKSYQQSRRWTLDHRVSKILFSFSHEWTELKLTQIQLNKNAIAAFVSYSIRLYDVGSCKIKVKAHDDLMRNTRSDNARSTLNYLANELNDYCYVCGLYLFLFLFLYLFFHEICSSTFCGYRPYNRILEWMPELMILCERKSSGKTHEKEFPCSLNIIFT
jgi:hypothetical protein